MEMNPPIADGTDAEKEAIFEVAKLMLVAARTAPKTSGKDDIVTAIIYGREKDLVAKKMERIGEQRGLEGFKRDAKNVRDSEAVILVAVRGNKNIGLNCGGCGFEDCEEFSKQEKRLGKDFIGPQCIYKSLDLGIALGSAVKVASILNVDNRVMYRIGSAAMKLKLLPEASVIMGIPLSARGKNIYFDRSK